MKTLVKKLAKIQQQLRAPKSQRNAFGKYNYRSCEDILESVKPLLGECIITFNDDIVEIASRVYLKTIASFSDGENYINATAFSREPLTRKGMDDSQITGATMSYCHKYALSSLLCIDDNKDPDATNEHEKKTPTPKPQNKPVMPKKPTAKENDQKVLFDTIKKVIGLGNDLEVVLKKLGVSKKEELLGFKSSEMLEAYTLLKNEYKL